jgi:hypothetical protein
VTLSVRALLRGHVAPATIELRGPGLLLHRDAAGGISFGGGVASAEPGQPGGAAAPGQADGAATGSVPTRPARRGCPLRRILRDLAGPPPPPSIRPSRLPPPAHHRRHRDGRGPAPSTAAGA